MVEAPVEVLPFEAGTWKGYIRFACPYCPFAGIKGSDQIAEHIAKAHPAKWLEE